MRKLLFTLSLAAVVAALMAGLASGAATHRCGTRYTPRCSGPAVVVTPPSLQCKAPGKSVALAPIKASSIAGIRKITIKVDGKTVKTYTFHGSGPQHKTVSGVSISTKGYKAGVHTVTVTTTDVKGKTATRTVRFTVCTVKPAFTG
jgi:hypothetical protein